jgi:CMP-N-acetylneuraminic acid synthetase
VSAAILEGVAWGLLPARGGSKSIPLKNLAPLAGRPLIDYNILAARAAATIDRLLCSTDHPAIADHCRSMAVEIHERPAELAGDDTPVNAVIAHLLDDIGRREGAVAEFVALLQPTSPFLLPAQIDACIAALRNDPGAGSAQTVTPCPHNHHAYNQRVITDGRVDFRFPAERQAAYNKQKKPPHYVFGNLVVFRSAAFRAAGTVFAGPSIPIPVPPPYDFDADGPADFRLASLMVEHRLVDLPVLASSFH